MVIDDINDFKDVISGFIVLNDETDDVNEKISK